LRIPSQVLQEIVAIQEDRVQGAGDLARKAAGALGLMARQSRARDADEFLEELDNLGSLLVEARPSMATIQRAVISLVRSVHIRSTEKRDTCSLRDLTVKLVEEFQRLSRLASAEAAAVAARALGGFVRVLTNSRSSTVIDALIRWASPERQVVITESRPLREGIDTAKALSRANLDLNLITDAQAGLFVPRVEAVLVGADSVLRDGAIVNKAGTLLLALAAHRFGVPFYVACDTLKFYVSPKQEEPALEEKDSREVLEDESSGFTVRNIYFDITPPDLLTGIATEIGLLTPEEASQVIREKEKELIPWIKRLASL